MNLAQMKSTFGFHLSMAIARLQIVSSGAEPPILFCVSATHPMAEVMHKRVHEGCPETARTCGGVAEVMAGIVEPKVFAEIATQCGESLLAQEIAKHRTHLVVFWCGDDAFDTEETSALIKGHFGEMKRRQEAQAARADVVRVPGAAPVNTYWRGLA
jgi:hypothetical protein